MANVFDINNWFWSVSDTNPGTSVFKTKSGVASGFVSLSDADFLAWLSAGGTSFGVNQKISAAADNGAGGTRLTIQTTGSAPFAMTTGAKYNISGTGGLYDGNQTITVINSTQVDIAVAFAGTATGTFVGATIIDTAVSLQQVLNQAGLGLLVITGNYYQPVHLGISGNTTLSNPLSVISFITNSSASTVNVQLPPMNQPNSIPEGLLFIISNQLTSAGAIQVQDQSNVNLGPILYPGDKLFLWLDSNSSVAGTLDSFRLPRFATPTAAASADGRIPVSQSLASPPATASWVAPSGDVSMTDLGAFTVSKFNGNNPIHVADGGTGAASLTAHGILLGEGTSAVTPTAAMTDGQLLVGQTGADPLPKTITGDVTFTAAGASALGNIPNDTTMAGDVLATDIVAPSTPASGKARIYVDSTSKNIAVKNDAGTVNHGVQTKAAVSHNFLTAIADDGSSTAARPASTDLSDLPIPVASGGTGDTGTAWGTWVPVVTSSVGTLTTVTTNSARFKTLGKTVFFEVDVTLTNVGTGSGFIKITSPVNAANFNYAGGGAEVALNGKELRWTIGTAPGVGNFAVAYYDNATNLFVNGTEIVLTGIYESA